MNNYTTKLNYHHISDVERGQIKAYLEAGLTQAEIARKLGRNRSTISREIKRGSVTVIVNKNGYQVDAVEYSPVASKEKYTNNRRKSVHRNIVQSGKILPTFIEQLIKAVKGKPRIHSIDTFIQSYKQTHPREKVPCTSTVYRYVHQQLIAIKAIDLPMVVRRKARKKKKETCPHKKKLGNSIELRPERINERQEVGHFEIDLVHGVMGKNEKVIMTMVDRRSRYGIVRLLKDGKAETVNAEINSVLRELGRSRIKSITADNGSEFSLLTKLETRERKVYFAHPYASYERGSNENFNGLLREFLPKGKSFNHYTKQYVKSVERALNARPRRILNYNCAKEVFFETAR